VNNELDYDNIFIFLIVLLCELYSGLNSHLEIGLFWVDTFLF